MALLAAAGRKISCVQKPPFCEHRSYRLDVHRKRQAYRGHSVEEDKGLAADDHFSGAFFDDEKRLGVLVRLYHALSF